VLHDDQLPLITEGFKNLEVTLAAGQVVLMSLSVYQEGRSESGRFPALPSTALGIVSISVAASEQAHYRGMDIVIGAASLGVCVWTLFSNGRQALKAGLTVVPDSSEPGASWSPGIMFTLRR